MLFEETAPGFRLLLSPNHENTSRENRCRPYNSSLKGIFAMNELVMRCLSCLTHTATTRPRTEGAAVHRRLVVWALLPMLALASLAMPASAQTTLQAEIVKHLTTSRDFTLKVADAMPAADYGFKLTPPQMSFAGQMVHLSQSFTYFLSAFSGQKPNPGKPKSESKEDVMAFVRQSFDDAIATVGKLTPEQLAKTYQSGEGPASGTELLLGML